MLGLAHGAQERRQQVGDARRAHARDQRHPSGDAVGVQPRAQLDGLLGGRRGPELHAERVVDAGEELDVRAVQLARTVADPEHVGGAVVPVARERVAPRERLLVVEQQALVARPDVDLVQLRRRREVDAACGHEGQRALDLGGHQLVALALRRALDEVLVPCVHLLEIGEATLGEPAHRFSAAAE